MQGGHHMFAKDAVTVLAIESSVQATSSREVVSPGVGLVLTGLAGACVLVGSVSLSDAATGWQQVLNVRHVPTCANFTVTGWNSTATVALTATALIFLATTAWAMLGTRSWGEGTALLAAVPIVILWLDTMYVGESPLGDCDGIGLTGAAGDALNRAGWLLFASVLLCCAASLWLKTKVNQGRAVY